MPNTESQPKGQACTEFVGEIVALQGIRKSSRLSTVDVGAEKILHA